MTLKEALLLVNSADRRGDPFEALLACGYSPLHLKTFLAAYLTRELPGRVVSVATGLYGDLPGTLAAARQSEQPPQAITLSVEWPDLDPRLGYRRLGGWGASEMPDIVASCRTQLEWLAEAIANLPAGVSLAVAGPTLQPAPAAQTPGWIASAAELELRQAVAQFLLSVASGGGRILDSGYLDRASSPSQRFDARSELFAGFPFTREHASSLAEAFTRLLVPENPKKGLITDLDDTLWKGIVGEVGADAIAWDLDRKAQIHGLYQQMLASLGKQGALLAIASKNEAANVEAAFERPDIQIQRDSFFPAEVHWSPKSGSVSRILEAWNVGPDSVVFIDDSPGEIGEVQAAHPDLECILFPKGDPVAAIRLLTDLRDKFGKTRTSDEDALRLDSLRSAAELREASDSKEALDRFLSSAGGKLTIDLVSDDARTLELINKTNQFNLNGIRYTEGDWSASRALPGAFTFSILYEDKFGPLGKIAVLHGHAAHGAASVACWVMSCRAFSRRIEYHALQTLFERLGVDRVELQFEQTPKNGPIASLLLDLAGPDRAVITKDEFLARLPPLHHQVIYAES